MLQFLLLTSSKQLIETPSINTQCWLMPLSSIWLNAALGIRSTWPETGILSETAQYNSLDKTDGVGNHTGKVRLTVCN